MAESSLSDSIRQVLNAAEDSLTAREIVDALKAAEVEFNEGSVHPLLRQRHQAGELIKNEMAGRVAYTVNPDFKLNTKKARKRVGGAPQAPAAALAPPGDFAARAEAGDAVIAAADKELRQAAPVMSPALQSLVTDPVLPKPRPRTPMALDERIAAIAEDLEAAVADACDARLPHTLIKDLATAGSAVSRASGRMRL